MYWGTGLIYHGYSDRGQDPSLYNPHYMLKEVTKPEEIFTKLAELLLHTSTGKSAYSKIMLREMLPK
jgi:hypothetical protein